MFFHLKLIGRTLNLRRVLRISMEKYADRYGLIAKTKNL